MECWNVTGGFLNVAHMEPQRRWMVQMIFLFKWVRALRFQLLILQGSWFHMSNEKSALGCLGYIGD